MDFQLCKIAHVTAPPQIDTLYYATITIDFPHSLIIPCLSLNLNLGQIISQPGWSPFPIFSAYEHLICPQVSVQMSLHH